MIEQPTEDGLPEKGKEWLVRSSMDLTICMHSLHSDIISYYLQVIVKKSGDVSQVWSKADADKMWNEGEVLLGFPIFVQLVFFYRDSSL